MTVLGLGVEGIDLVRYLSRQGARVTVSDSRTAEQLRDALDAIADDAPALSLGKNDLEVLLDADAVYASQGVPWHLPVLDEARARGVTVSSMTRLFFERCPAPIAGITGSSGKTTTTALTAAMLEAAGIDHVVGGNIGVGLLGLLDDITPTTRVVAEVSHTQLQSVEVSPHWAALTNVTPNHLDQFSWEDYVELKERVFAYQDADDFAIFNADDEVSRDLASKARGTRSFTSLSGVLPADGVTVDAGAVVRVDAGLRTPVISREEIRLRGDHNVANVLQAVALASLLGVPDDAAAEAIRAFRGVPHRLESVIEVAGVTWVNDSIATTPERTVAGLRSYQEPVVLLLGGRDKNLPLADLATEAARRCRAVVTFGEAGDLFAAALREAGVASVERAEDVARAVEFAARVARRGDVVLFSPAGTSFDAYPNFERRGEAFREAVRALDAGSTGEGGA